MKYDQDQLQDQDHLSSIIEFKVAHYTIWYCLNQSFMFQIKNWNENDKWRNSCANINWEQKKIISNMAILIPKYDMKVIFGSGDQRSKIKINCKRSPVQWWSRSTKRLIKDHWSSPPLACTHDVNNCFWILGPPPPCHCHTLAIFSVLSSAIREPPTQCWHHAPLSLIFSHGVL